MTPSTQDARATGLVESAENVADAVHKALWEADAKIAALEKDNARLNRERTDRGYMIAALVPMLGPVARQVWALWQKKNITRLHTDWAIDPMTMAGEEVAALHLKFEAACRDAVPIDDFDGHLRALAASTKDMNHDG